MEAQIGGLEARCELGAAVANYRGVPLPFVDNFGVCGGSGLVCCRLYVRCGSWRTDFVGRIVTLSPRRYSRKCCYLD